MNNTHPASACSALGVGVVWPACLYTYINIRFWIIYAVELYTTFPKEFLWFYNGGPKPKTLKHRIENIRDIDVAISISMLIQSSRSKRATIHDAQHPSRLLLRRHIGICQTVYSVDHWMAAVYTVLWSYEVFIWDHQFSDSLLRTLKCATNSSRLVFYSRIRVSTHHCHAWTA